VFFYVYIVHIHIHTQKDKSPHICVFLSHVSNVQQHAHCSRQPWTNEFSSHVCGFALYISDECTFEPSLGPTGSRQVRTSSRSNDKTATDDRPQPPAPGRAPLAHDGEGAVLMYRLRNAESECVFFFDQQTTRHRQRLRL
jgi:hypothetical protein